MQRCVMQRPFGLKGHDEISGVAAYGIERNRRSRYALVDSAIEYAQSVSIWSSVKIKAVPIITLVQISSAIQSEVRNIFVRVRTLADAILRFPSWV